eukprot:Gb_19935 [translate_table: standard]
MTCILFTGIKGCRSEYSMEILFMPGMSTRRCRASLSSKASRGFLTPPIIFPIPQDAAMKGLSKKWVHYIQYLIQAPRWRKWIPSIAEITEVAKPQNHNASAEEQEGEKHFLRPGIANFMAFPCNRYTSHCDRFCTELCKPQSNPLASAKYEHICGRPLGLWFNNHTSNLCIADAYFGLMRVSPEGGLTTHLVSEAEGVPLKFNNLDIDEDGTRG